MISYKPYSAFPDVAVPPNFPRHMPYMQQFYETGDEQIGFIVVTQEEYDALVAQCLPLVQMSQTAAYINAKIKSYQEASPVLLRELYVENTMAGITSEQSDAIFDEYQDIIVRLKEGAFPTALHRLSQKQPTGFITQTLIDKWRLKIEAYL